MNKLEEKAIERVEELLKDDIFECIVVSDAERCYIEGYKDAQKETMDRACEWLKNNAYFYVNDLTGDLDEIRLAKDLKKAMEE